MALEVVIDKLRPGWQVEHLLDELETRSGLGSDAVDASRHYFLPGDGSRLDSDGLKDLMRMLDRISPAWHSHLRVSRVQPWMPFIPEHVLELPRDPDHPGERRFALRLSQKRIGTVWLRERDAQGAHVDLGWVADRVNEGVSMFGHSGLVARLLSPRGLRLWADSR